MSLLRFLGLSGEFKADPDKGETASVRRIAGMLEQLGTDRAKFLAAFAYVLARIANADLTIDDSETSEMERVMRTLSGLSETEVALTVEIATSQAQVLGGTENYVVTREFRQISTREQREQLLQCIYAVAAADGSISTIEASELTAIANELGFTRPEANALRSQYRDKLAVLQTTA